MKALYIAWIKVLMGLRKQKYKFLAYIHLRKCGRVRFDKAVRIEKGCSCYFRQDGSIQIAGNSLLCRNTKIVVQGGNLRIGKQCTFGEGAIFNVFDNITIGNGVLAADKVSFITNSHHYENIGIPIYNQGGGCAPIKIGSGTWIGLNAVILPGTTIGKNCVVGANAVVRGGAYPDGCVLAGVPAKIVKQYDPVQGQWASMPKRKNYG